MENNKKDVSVGKFALKIGKSVLTWVAEIVLFSLLVANALPEFYWLFDIYKTKYLHGIYQTADQSETWYFKRDVLVIYNEVGFPGEIWKFSAFNGVLTCEIVASSSGATTKLGEYISIKYKKQGNELILGFRNGDTRVLKYTPSADVINTTIMSTEY